MPATITHYRSDDASAPVLSTAAGSFISLLDACLVTGYGAKAAAGWTKPYTGTNKAAFQMATGTGKNGVFLRCEDFSGYCNVSGYGTMSDVDTGTERFGTDSTACNMGKPSATSTWELIATDTYFYLFTGETSSLNTYLGASMFFGQYNTALSLSGKNNCIIARSDTGYSNSLPLMASVAAGAYAQCDALAAYSSPNGSTFARYGAGSSPMQVTNFLEYPSWDTGSLEGRKIELRSGTSNARRLGWLPGSFEALHNSSVLAFNTDYEYTTGNIFRLLPLVAGSATGYGIMIQTEGTPI